MAAQTIAPSEKPVVAQQQVTVTATGKKKIVPIMTQAYHNSKSKIDPSMNPFMSQQLVQEEVAMVADKTSDILMTTITEPQKLNLDKPLVVVQEPKPMEVKPAPVIEV